MKLLFDHNISYRLIAALRGLYPDSEHVSKIGLAAAEDDDIWSYAREHGFAIVSKDSDFYYRSMLLGHPPKVVWIRSGNCSTAHILTILTDRQPDLLLFNNDGSASFLALS